MKGILFSILLFGAGVLFFRIYKPLSKKRDFSFFHVLWGLLLITTFVFRVRTTEELMANPLDTAGMFRFFTILLVFLSSFIYMSLNKFSGIVRKKDYLIFSLLGYITLGLISFVYSPIPKLTIYKSFELLADLLLLLVLLRPLNLKALKIQFDINYFIILFLLVSAWFWVPIWPQRATIKYGYFNFILRGAMPLQDADMVSIHAAILAIGAYVRSRIMKHKKTYKFLFLFSVITLIFGQARTSIIGFLIAMLVIFLLLKEKKKLFIAILFIFFALESNTIYNVLYLYFLKGSQAHIVKRLGGRLDWWEIGFKAFLDSPILGNGFATGGRIIAKSIMGGLISVYNTFIEIGINLGIMGLSLFSFSYFGTFLRLWYFYTRKISSRINIIKNRNPLLLSMILESLGIFILLTFRAMTSLALGEHGITMLIFLSLLGLAEYTIYQRRELF